MNWDFVINPQLPFWLIFAIAALTGVLVLFGLYKGLRGSLFRALAWAALTLALLNPSLLNEDRERLKSVVAIIADNSQSQKIDDREKQTADAVKAIEERLGSLENFEVRSIKVENIAGVESDASTALFEALRTGLQDVPPDRIAGAVLVTDGQVHDIPKDLSALGLSAPVHALITGREDERDRRIEILNAPRFGIVGDSQELTFKIHDTNIENASSVNVRVLIDGDLYSTELVQPGEEAAIVFDVPHGGKTIIELEAEIAENEITNVNNRAFVVMDGIRENLRVLLVSGEPHAGERTWRNLLKSDASVDLVHFTILRPPEKQDGTPINQLSLIAFPTRKLFVEKIDEFDLIIFDRYQRRGVLPVLYFDNIARYVEEGGAVLIAAGPEYASSTTIHNTPLAPILLGRPTGSVTEVPFRPSVSDIGKKHPVTRQLDGSTATPPNWSRWFRSIDITEPRGDVVMNGPGETPLLMLDRPGTGRIAMLMSDHAWLWARGFEGGGPHVQLLRRLSHWLMKEPELDEEALTAETKADQLVIERQTMGENPGQVSVITPTGKTLSLDLTDQGNGIWLHEHKAEELGLYQVANSDLRALAHVGPTNPREYREVISTTESLAPIVRETGGRVQRISSGGDIPRLVPVRARAVASGENWFGLKTTQASVLKGVSRLPMFSGLLGLALLLLALGTMWAREGR